MVKDTGSTGSGKGACAAWPVRPAGDVWPSPVAYNTTIEPRDVIGIGVDTTGSSPMPVDAEGQALCFNKKFQHDPAAMVWLWKDHTSYAEAALITETAKTMRPQYMAKVGGTYSSEWFWSKILHCKNTAPETFQASDSFVEICDWIPAVLAGTTHPKMMKRSICAAGHKAMFNEQWGGLPDKAFL